MKHTKAEVIEILKETLYVDGNRRAKMYWVEGIEEAADRLCEQSKEEGVVPDELRKQFEKETGNKLLNHNHSALTYATWLERKLIRPTITKDRIDDLATEYSRGHYTDPESIKQAYDDYYTGFEGAIKELTKTK